MHIKPGIASLLCAAASVVTFSTLGDAQQTPALAQPTVRITQAISSHALLTLKGNTDRRAKAQFDQGSAESSLATGRLALLLRPSAAQQSALRVYLGELHDPHSAHYHQWLTPAAYGANFGVSDQDLETVENWLRSEGFTIDSVPASRNLIQFSGTFGQVAQTFHTSMHAYRISGAVHYANATDPSIPAALAPVVLGVSPLNDFRPTPSFVQQLRGQARASGGHVQMTHMAASAASPAYTSPINQTTYLLLTPADAATIYDAPNTLNGKFAGSTQQTGAGVKIGLVGDSDLPLQDYLNYRSLLLNEGANPVPPTQVVDGRDPGQVNDGGSEEALVDAEFSAGLAPKASIYFYSSADDILQSGPYDAALRAVEDNTVSLLSMSFSQCESDLGQDGNAQLSALWEQAAAQGITVLVSSGDAGSASCDTDAGSQNVAQYGLSVNGLGSTPYNISVGGTDFDVLGQNFAQYVSTTSGLTGPYYRSVAGYIPENPWNESISNNPPGSYADNLAEQYPTSDGGSETILAAGGGGASNAAFCTGGTDSSGDCLDPAGYATPSFQTGISISGQNPDAPLTGVRYLPDVSLFASSGSEHPVTWLLCADSTVTGYSTSYVDCQPNASGSFGFDGVGGTSTSSPAFAGILAMVTQSLGGQRLGLANNTLYNLYATNSNAANIFHDVTAGNNAVPCASGSTNCATNGFLTGFNAGTGYDLATGLGSVDVSNLVNAWKQVQFTSTTVALTAGTTSNSLSDAPISIMHGSAVTLAASVAPGTAIGDVSVTSPTGQSGAAVSETIPLASGSGSVTVSDLPGGSYSLQAYYQGDVKDSPSTSSSPIEFTVAPEASSPFLFTCAYDPSSGDGTANPTSITYGENGFAYINPANTSATSSCANGFGAGSNGFASGTATLLNNNVVFTTPFSGTETLNSQGVAAYPLYNLAPGTYAFGASYAGDASYNSSKTSAALPLTISKGPTTVTVHVGSATAAAPGAIQVELDTDSVGANPTGAVTLTVNGQSYTGTGTTNGVQSSGAVSELVSFTVPTSVFNGSGGANVAATYAGDANYAGSTAGACTFVPPTTTAALRPPVPTSSRQPLLAAAGCGLCGILFLLIPARKRAWRPLLVLCFAVGLLGVTGCGTSNAGSNTSPITVHSTCAK